jgi:hypothetical protein
MLLKLDHTTSSVSLIQDFIAPYEFISASQGNLQVLGTNQDWATSNIFLGWGSNAYISEYTPDGRVVQEGHFATSGSMNYRAFKHNFTSNPTDAPAVYTYAHNTSAPTVYWMSWNGATKAAQWRIYASTSRNGPWTVVDTVNKTGFETTFTAPRYHPWSMVESLDGEGNALKNNTRPSKTFVPGAQLAAACDSSQCPVAVSREPSSSTQTEKPTATSSSAATHVHKRGMTGELGFAAIFGMGAMVV